jgi:hypothetical protein
MHPTMTADQAAALVAGYATGALSALRPGAALAEVVAGAVDCTDPDDHGPAGRVTRYAEHVVTGIPADAVDEQFENLLTWSAGHGYRVLTDGRPAQRYLWLEHEPDGFRLALQANDRAELYLTSTSPCVWPTGTPG